jgi:hypothetical protein
VRVDCPGERASAAQRWGVEADGWEQPDAS